MPYSRDESCRGKIQTQPLDQVQLKFRTYEHPSMTAQTVLIAPLW